MDSSAATPRGPVRHVLIVLACDDVARSREFYVSAFDWRVAVALPVYVELEVPTGLRVGLYARAGFRSNTCQPVLARPAEGTTACELYLRVDGVDAALARCLAAGGRLLSGKSPRPWGDEAGYVADPDGNVVAVSRPLEDDEGAGAAVARREGTPARHSLRRPPLPPAAKPPTADE